MSAISEQDSEAFLLLLGQSGVTDGQRPGSGTRLLAADWTIALLADTQE